MKTQYVPQLITIFILSSILSACESHEKKVDEAFENFKEEKMSQPDNTVILADTNIKHTQIINEPVKIQTKKINEDEWTKFKSEVEKKIIQNEIQIKEIKVSVSLTAKELKKTSSLEKENNDLRRKMEEFKEDEKIKLEKFKLNINNDANEINLELKGISLTKAII